MTSKLSFRTIGLALCCAATLAVGTGAARAQTVAVMVNGEPITNLDIEQRMKLNNLSHKSASRKEVLDELIDEGVVAECEIVRRNGQKHGGFKFTRTMRVSE